MRTSGRWRRRNDARRRQWLIWPAKRCEVEGQQVGPAAVAIRDPNESLEGDRLAAQQIGATAAAIGIHRDVNVVLAQVFNDVSDTGWPRLGQPVNRAAAGEVVCDYSLSVLPRIHDTCVLMFFSGNAQKSINASS